MLFKDGHGTFQLPALPHPAAGVVGTAQDHGVNLVLYNFALHILKVHAPYPVFIFHQVRVDNMVAVVLQAHGKANVGGGVDQNMIPFGAQYVQSTDDPAQYTVFVAGAGSNKKCSVQ